jgi:DnaJ-class molecular chaperone
VLNLKVPPPHKPVDLTAAKKAKRNLVRAYHPDHNGEGTRAAYEAVIDAYRTIEMYAEQTERG